MNAKEIEDMAYKSGFWTADTSFGGVCWIGNHAELQRFADLVLAHEREKFCAVLRQLHDSYSLPSDPTTIRARGQE